MSADDATPLTLAHRAVYGERRQSYGTPAENHARTAALWSAYLGVEVTARQVCMLNVLQKVSRDAHCPQLDNLVDIAGYAENAHLVDDGDAPRTAQPIVAVAAIAGWRQRMVEAITTYAQACSEGRGDWRAIEPLIAEAEANWCRHADTLHSVALTFPRPSPVGGKVRGDQTLAVDSTPTNQPPREGELQ